MTKPTTTETVAVSTEDIRSLRDAVSALYLDSPKLTDLIMTVVSAASAIVPPGVWDDRSAPFVWDNDAD
jgi:hypothetical protein